LYGLVARGILHACAFGKLTILSIAKQAHYTKEDAREMPYVGSRSAYSAPEWSSQPWRA
jgi:hypothetical protein